MANSSVELISGVLIVVTDDVVALEILANGTDLFIELNEFIPDSPSEAFYVNINQIVTFKTTT